MSYKPSHACAGLQAGAKNAPMVAIVCCFEECSTSAAAQTDMLRSVQVQPCKIVLRMQTCAWLDISLQYHGTF